MRVGVTLPSMGHLAQPNNLIEVAQEAERLGYDTLWAADRLLYPLNPRTKYPVTADGSWPKVYKRVLDPIESLTFVAAHTSRIGLGTSVLDLPFYNPVILARRHPAGRHGRHDRANAPDGKRRRARSAIARSHR